MRVFAKLKLLAKYQKDRGILKHFSVDICKRVFKENVAFFISRIVKGLMLFCIEK